MTPGALVADRYEARERIGEGHTGEVWGGVEGETGRQVAMKWLFPWLTPDQPALARLQHETLISGRVKHKGIVDVLGVYREQERWVLVTERVRGRPLSELTEALDLQHALLVGLQVARALHAAHQSGAMHGDLRPGNVLLGDTGAKVFDFGLASCAGALRSSGTEVPLQPGRTAPEVLQGAPIGVAADLYGLGLVMYQALHGRPAFGGETALGRMGAQRDGLVSVAGMPDGVGALVSWLLEPLPDRRPPDMATAVLALERLRQYPNTTLLLPTRWLPPIRPRGAWVVHGVDPLTGADALIASDMGRRAARRLASDLADQGWQVRAERDGLSVRDLLWIASGAALGSLVVPPVGTVAAAYGAVSWRRRGVRPNLRTALPAVQAVVPRGGGKEPSEHGIAAGITLVGVALALALWPPAAVPLLLSLAVLGWSAWRDRRPRLMDVTRKARVETALLEASVALDRARPSLDRQLALQGELVALEQDWEAGRLRAQEVLERLEQLIQELKRGPADASELSEGGSGS